MNEFRPILKNSKFISLWTSQILSQVTINLMNFLLLLKLFEATRSTIATSLLWVAYALPAILIGPIAAASIDLVDKRKMLILTNLLQAVIIFIYALSQHESVFLLYGIAVIYSFLNQFYVPAEQASLPTLVKKINELRTGHRISRPQPRPYTKTAYPLPAKLRMIRCSTRFVWIDPKINSFLMTIYCLNRRVILQHQIA